MEEIQQTRIRCARKDSSVYPARLKELPGMPKQLYYIGSFPDDAKPTAAIVGARLCSPYGRIQAFNYGKFLSEHGVQVISGMAAGIDAEGHKGALEGGTPTFAVLGNGVDICYPSSSRGIYRRIPEKNGGIISEYEPGTKGRAYYFPGFMETFVTNTMSRSSSSSFFTLRCGNTSKKSFSIMTPAHSR